MKKITVWTPDTCRCEVHYTWNTDDPPETRVHTAHEATRGCPHHQGTHHEVFAKVLAENQKKNRVLGLVAEKFPELAPVWSHDETRTLHLAVGSQHAAVRQHLADNGHPDVVVE